MAFRNGQAERADNGAAEVFDRAHLAHYTMNSADLEREIIGLFLLQLPTTLEMIEEARTSAEWKLATHTLKGAAAAVGARRLNVLATALEQAGLEEAGPERNARIAVLLDAAAEFRATVGQIYP